MACLVDRSSSQYLVSQPCDAVDVDSMPQDGGVPLLCAAVEVLNAFQQAVGALAVLVR